MRDASLQEGGRPLQIVHYHTMLRLKQGGVVRAVLDLCALLATRGHSVALVSPDAADVPEAWRGGAANAPRIVEVSRLTRVGRRLDAGAMDSVRTLLSRADVLHLHGPWAPANWQVASLARRLGRPYVVSAHGMLDDWAMAQKRRKKHLFMALCVRRFLQRAACIHVNSPAEREQAARWVPAGRFFEAPLALALEAFATLPGPELARATFPDAAVGDPKVLVLCRLTEGKGVHLLIQAIALLRDRSLRCKLLIAGAGDPQYRAQLETLARGLQVERQVATLGLVTGPEKLSLYQAADVFALPSSHENFGMALAEAMACGMPVITTMGVNIWPELRSAGAIVLEDSGPNALADALARVLTAPAERAATGRRARAWALSYFEPARLAAGYESMYRCGAHVKSTID